MQYCMHPWFGGLKNSNETRNILLCVIVCLDLCITLTKISSRLPRIRWQKCAIAMFVDF
jgi:hypothetical protein